MTLAAMLMAQARGDEFAAAVRLTPSADDAATTHVEWHEANIVPCACGESGKHVVNPGPTVIESLNAWAQVQ